MQHKLPQYRAEWTKASDAPDLTPSSRSIWMQSYWTQLAIYLILLFESKKSRHRSFTLIFSIGNICRTRPNIMAAVWSRSICYSQNLLDAAGSCAGIVPGFLESHLLSSVWYCLSDRAQTGSLSRWTQPMQWIVKIPKMSWMEAKNSEHWICHEENSVGHRFRSHTNMTDTTGDCFSYCYPITCHGCCCKV